MPEEKVYNEGGLFENDIHKLSSHQNLAPEPGMSYPPSSNSEEDIFLDD